MRNNSNLISMNNVNIFYIFTTKQINERNVIKINKGINKNLRQRYKHEPIKKVSKPDT